MQKQVNRMAGVSSDDKSNVIQEAQKIKDRQVQKKIRFQKEVEIIPDTSRRRNFPSLFSVSEKKDFVSARGRKGSVYPTNLPPEEKSSRCCDKDPASDLETYDKSESDKGYGKTESEKGDLKTDSEESELESDRSLIDSDVCEGQIDGEAFGCGDGPCEPNIPEYEDEVKGSVAIRRHRGLQNTGQEGTLLDTEVKEPTFGEYQFQTWPENEENSGLNKENQVRGKKSLSQMTSGDAPVKSDTSVGSWAMYILPKTVCLIVLCMIYVGFMILSVKVLNYSPNKA